MSLRSSRSAALSNCSGAMWVGVPNPVPSIVCPDGLNLPGLSTQPGEARCQGFTEHACKAKDGDLGGLVLGNHDIGRFEVTMSAQAFGVSVLHAVADMDRPA